MIELLIPDVDGMLVTPDKVLTERARSAVRKLRAANIKVAITSGRPPRGMAMLVEPLGLTYYVDVTHPQANKGEVVGCLSKTLEVPMQRIATIADMPNDVLMFAVSGLGIAMGNANADVQRAARRVTLSNTHEGFAEVVERLVLPEHLFARNAKSPSPLNPAEPRSH